MSLFGDIANALGHTVDTLSQDLGVAVSDLEGVVNDLNSWGIDVFSIASRLGLSTVGFLRGITEIMRGDPHQVLLHRLTDPARPAEARLNDIAGQWTQLVALHQDTMQQINAQFTDLFQGGGSFSYSSPAASVLWNTHQSYQQYSVLLADHAQTQQSRYAVLAGHYSDYLNQAPGKVYSLSTPMAALGVLSFETADAAPPAPPPVWENPVVEGEVAVETDVAVAGLAGLPEDAPVLPVWAIILIIIAVIIVITVIVVLIIDATQNHQNQQKSTNTPKPPSKPQPVALSQQAEQLARKYQAQGIDVDPQDIQDMLDAGYTPEEIDKIIKNLQKIYGKSGVKHALHTLLTLGFTPAQAVAITNTMTQLNDPNSSPASSYLKGNPGDDVYADILAAMLVQSTQTSKTFLSSLQSAIQKARAKKGSNLTPDEIKAAVESTGTSWDSLPPDVQNLLLNKGGPPQFAYGNAIESLVKQDLQNNYAGAYKYYTKNLGLKIEPYTVLSDGSVQYPDFKFTDPATGQTIVEDLTSKGNMASKTKYDEIAAILIAIGY